MSRDYQKEMREAADYMTGIELENQYLKSAIEGALGQHACICEYGKGNPNAKGHRLQCQLLRSAIDLRDTEAARYARWPPNQL